MKYLYNANNQETAIIIHNYPYGFRLKTDIRYWIETKAKKGDRFCSQTLNPKTNKWNAPKCSTYSEIMIMKEEDNGYIRYTSFSHWEDEEKLTKWLENKDQSQFNQDQKDQLIKLKAIFRTRENLTYEIVNVTNLSQEEQAKRDEEQKENSIKLSKLYAYNLQQAKAEQ